LSTQYLEKRKSPDLSCDNVTSQSTTSKECFNKSKSQSVSSLRSVSSHYSLTSADVAYARLYISQDGAVVLLKTEDIREVISAG
jgi:hypothetical protein